ncbi:Trk system potassium transporter TrkA [Myxococcota bacterium]|nr:Trk system potassium transporter TrkA [Myxococcota bacterium]MBU1380724.1 Trk system potassium transporter TrkA [Myxococcota bacterium]MBU1498048.1 Trk system potassium transporter TrkA [Myxococcota bacterium]
MNIIIIGAGEVGNTLGEKLSMDDHDVTIIEPKPDRVRELQEDLDVSVIEGSGTDPQALRKAGIEDADLLICVADRDEVNITACIIAEAWGRKYLIKIARIRNMGIVTDSKMSEHKYLPVDFIINPELVAVDRIIDAVRFPQVTEILRFAAGRIALAEIELERNHWASGKTIMEIAEMKNLPVLIAMADDEGKMSVPGGNYRLQEGMKLHLIAKITDLGGILKRLTGKGSTYTDVIVGGGTYFGELISQRLTEEGIRVKLIESNRKRAFQLADNLRGVLVLNGDTTDTDLLTEEGINSCDLFVSVTDDDEVNVVSSLIASKSGAQRTVTLIKNGRLAGRLSKVNLGMIVSPRLVAVDHILHFISRGKLFSVSNIEGNTDINVLEFELNKTSLIVEMVLKDIKFPALTLIGAVIRNEQEFIPDGNFKLQKGDRILVFTVSSSVDELEKLIQGRGRAVTRR